MMFIALHITGTAYFVSRYVCFGSAEKNLDQILSYLLLVNRNL